MAAFQLLPAKPDLTVLPAQILSDGKVERSYPGAPGIAGWTIFLRTDKAYIYQTSTPIFPTEKEARMYLREHYHILINMAGRNTYRNQEIG
jgi:hypothetical protein